MYIFVPLYHEKSKYHIQVGFSSYDLAVIYFPILTKAFQGKSKGFKQETVHKINVNFILLAYHVTEGTKYILLKFNSEIENTF